MKKGRFFISLGLLLIAAALLLTAYNLWDNNRAGKAARMMLERLAPIIDAENGSSSDTDGDPYEDIPLYKINPDISMPTATIDGQDYIGVISIPALDRELPVISEWDYDRLTVAPCRFTGSAYKNDLIICAHNYVFHFGPISRLKYGDELTFTDMEGNEFRYVVSEIESVDADAINQMLSGDWDLTIFTCTVGGAARITVRCKLFDP